MKRVMARFVFEVYEDYTWKAKNVLEENNTNLPELIKESSARIAQSAAVILSIYMEKTRLEKEENTDNIDYNSLYNDAIRRVALELDLAVSTVRDKLERKLGNSASDTVKLLEDYFTGKNTLLKDKLINSLKNKKKQNKAQIRKDILAIEELFRYMETAHLTSKYTL